MEVSDEAITAAIARFAPIRSQGLLVNVLAFGRVLKQLGLRVTLSQVIDASRSLEHVAIERKADFHAVLRSNLVAHKDEIPIFDRVFDCFWDLGVAEEGRQDQPQGSNQSPEASAEAEGSGDGGQEVAEALSETDEEPEDSEPLPFPTYSPYASLRKKDFSEMGIEESRAIRRAILQIAAKIATQISRRRKRASKGNDIDLRWTLRRNIKYGGEVMELVPRKRRIKKTRIVLLCDVSGSMDCYSRFLIQFMYGLQNELWGMETFVFSTTLTRITHLIRTKDIERALEQISQHVVGWSGGTNIGRSFSTFNQEFAPGMLTHRTVVVIISDGWDRGDIGLLEREMQRLRRRSGTIIWLNPLLASENYEPLCKGMQAALPYLDLFLSIHNLDSLVRLGRTLQSLSGQYQ